MRFILLVVSCFWVGACTTVVIKVDKIDKCLDFCADSDLLEMGYHQLLGEYCCRCEDDQIWFFEDEEDKLILDRPFNERY